MPWTLILVLGIPAILAAALSILVVIREKMHVREVREVLDQLRASRVAAGLPPEPDAAEEGRSAAPEPHPD
jgi:hypothetical protein